jgi:predicted transcriptional regulator of viral defense system
MKRKFARLSDYVDAEQAVGRYTFTASDARAALGVSVIALQTAARRLAAKKRIVSPLRGFFVIVPVEYRAAGAPPASWFIHALMSHRGRPYYVGLLSAAAMHGAAHQAPQELHVITDRHMRPITVGRVRIRFFYKKDLARAKSMPSKTDTGHMLISTPEVTALDLVRYPHGAGSLSAVATVLAELAEQLDAKRLLSAAKAMPELATVQRAGWLLARVGSWATVRPLQHWLASRQPPWVKLSSSAPSGDGERDVAFSVIVNAQIELDT